MGREAEIDFEQNVNILNKDSIGTVVLSFCSVSNLFWPGTVTDPVFKCSSWGYECVNSAFENTVLLLILTTELGTA